MLHRAGVEFKPVMIIISGINIQASGVLGPIHKPLEAGGDKLVQVFNGQISKSILPDEPTVRTTFTIDNRTFTIREVTGRDAHVAAWGITATRTFIPSEA